MCSQGYLLSAASLLGPACSLLACALLLAALLLAAPAGLLVVHAEATAGDTEVVCCALPPTVPSLWPQAHISAGAAALGAALQAAGALHRCSHAHTAGGSELVLQQ